MNAFQGHKRFGWMLVAPSVILLLCVGLVPLIYAVYTAIHRTSPNPAVPPRLDVFFNLSGLFRDPQFVKALINTGIMLLGGVTIKLCLGLILALALTQLVRFRTVAISLILIPSALAPIVVGVAWWMMFSPVYGPVNGVLEQVFHIPGVEWTIRMPYAMFAVITGTVWQSTPFVAMILLGGLLSIPEVLIESAQLDGANRWQLLRHIQLPLIRPYFLIAGLLMIINTALAYEIPWFTTEGGPGNETVVMGIYLYKLAFTFGDYGRASAMSLFVVFVLSILAAIYIRLLQGRQKVENQTGKVS